MRLHQRLRTWMPRGLNYCAQCRRFTRRKPQHKGRCKYVMLFFLFSFLKSLNLFQPGMAELILTFRVSSGYHGRPKQRISKSNFWTYYSHRGGFGRYRAKMWRKWFNNQSMNRFEARLGRGAFRGRTRTGDVRYEFRELAPKVVNTQKMRY